MYVAGDPSLGLVLPTLLGGSLSAGGAGRGQPLLRPRHRRADGAHRRPAGARRARLARARRSPSAARSRRCRSSCCRSAVNPLAAALSLSGFLGYVVRLHDLAQAPHAAEHRHRRRRGRRAAARRLGGDDRRRSTGTALYLFAIVFFWTPPHFWALSLLMKDEYARVGVPMLPVVRGEAETRRQILLYTRPALRGDAAAVLRGRVRARSTSSRSLAARRAFIAGCRARSSRRADRRDALRLYLFSLAYLALLFGTMVARRPRL